MVAWSLSDIDTRRWSIQSASLWRPPVGTRRASFVVPGRHGAITPGLPVFDEPELPLRLRVKGAEVDLEAAQAELIGLLSAPGLTVTRASGGVVASAGARLVSVAPVEFVCGVLADFAVNLAIPGVFLRGPLATSDDVVVTSGATVEVPHLATSTGPVTDAVIRVAGPCTTVAVTDVTTGTGLSVTGAGLAAGRFLYLDAGRLRAWESASAEAWSGLGGTDRTSRLDYPAAGMLQLWPRMRAADPSDRVAALTVTGSGFAGSTAIAVRAAPAYL